ncbi:nucleoside diphosphate kinase regulator [Noviherbaspirillum agri]
MKPEIIVTSTDLERLEAIIDSMPASSPSGVALLEELQRADIVEPDDVPHDVVTMNSTVRFSLGTEGEEFCRTLVYPRDVVDSTTISVLSPVGSALLGLSTGSSIEWPSPSGTPLVVSIIDIVQQPEHSKNLAN